MFSYYALLPFLTLAQSQCKICCSLQSGSLGPRQSSLGGGVDAGRGLLSGALVSHKANHSIGSNLSSGTVLDEAAMRELDQVALFQHKVSG